jgi:hypothetical protein
MFNYGDIVKVNNETLETNQSKGRVINIRDDGLISVKLNTNFVIHRSGYATHIVRYNPKNLELIKTQAEEESVLAHLYGARENDFDKVCYNDYVVCLNIQDAREEIAKMIEWEKKTGIQYFWVTINHMPRQVDIEKQQPRLVKVH